MTQLVKLTMFWAVGKASLAARSFETDVDVGGKRSLPSRQILAKQCCFDVASQVSSRVHGSVAS